MGTQRRGCSREWPQLWGWGGVSPGGFGVLGCTHPPTHTALHSPAKPRGQPPGDQASPDPLPTLGCRSFSLCPPPVTPPPALSGSAFSSPPSSWTPPTGVPRGSHGGFRLCRSRRGGGGKHPTRAQPRQGQWPGLAWEMCQPVCPPPAPPQLPKQRCQRRGRLLVAPFTAGTQPLPQNSRGRARSWGGGGGLGGGGEGTWHRGTPPIPTPMCAAPQDPPVLGEGGVDGGVVSPPSEGVGLGGGQKRAPERSGRQRAAPVGLPACPPPPQKKNIPPSPARPREQPDPRGWASCRGRGGGDTEGGDTRGMGGGGCGGYGAAPRGCGGV